MIKLLNNRANTAIVTTQEKVTGTPTYYVFKFINKLTNDELLFIPIGLLPYGGPDRYNAFDFELGTIDDPVNGYILNLEEGQWNYEIYSEYGTAPTTNPVTLGSWANLCESGRIIIK